MQDPKPITDILSSGDALSILGLIVIALLVVGVLIAKKVLGMAGDFLGKLVSGLDAIRVEMSEIKEATVQHLAVATEIREGTQSTVEKMQEWGTSAWLRDDLGRVIKKQDQMLTKMDAIHTDVLRQKGASP